MKNTEIKAFEYFTRSITVAKQNAATVEKAMQELDGFEQQIVLYMIANAGSIRDNAPLKIPLEITAFYRMAGIKEVGGSQYTHLKEKVKSLRDKGWKMKELLPNGKIAEVTVGWISKAEIVPADGTISLTVDEELKPYLLLMNSMTPSNKSPLANPFHDINIIRPEDCVLVDAF